jgi:predicted esterase
MKRMRALVPLLGLVLLAALLPTVAAPPAFAPPKSRPPDEATQKTIKDRHDKLLVMLGQLERHGVKKDLLTDVEIYAKAAELIAELKEFYDPDAGQWTLEVLDRGLLRASQQARGEMPWLLERGHAVVRAYRSGVDGSLQPYAVTYPRDYNPADMEKHWPIHIVMHGRDPRLTEVKFLHQHNGDKDVPAEQDWIQLDVFGRGNNGYRWAGETDIREAAAHFYGSEALMGRLERIDRRRCLLRGFSMGGAGAWHLGLHEPDQWNVIGPGAGFVTTHGYVEGFPEKLPPYQEACLRIYDALDCAENAYNVPVVAYAGSKDRQLAAARAVQEKLAPLKIDIKLLVGEGLGHDFPAEWQKKAQAEYARHLAKERDEYPRRVHFVTYTLRYAHCDWVRVLAMDKHFEQALVDAEYRGEEGYTVKTTNVRALRLRLPPRAIRQPLKVVINGQTVEALPTQSRRLADTLNVHLERQGKQWREVLREKLDTEAARLPQKLNLMQGPIDDAFMAPFLCVSGKGTGWHERTESYAEANLQRFKDEWERYFRGTLQIKNDVDVTSDDIATHHLILFGDPSSNRLIEQVLPALPFTWDKDKIVWQGKEYASAEHVPVMIYPSPLSLMHYVVINSGHTFHAKDFQGSNALLYPRLGDFALLKLTDKKDPLAAEVVNAGLFDDFWHLPRR